MTHLHVGRLVMVAATGACLARSAAALQLFGTQTSSPNVAEWGLIRLETGPITGGSDRIGAGGLGFDGDFSPGGEMFAPGGGDRLYRWDTVTGARTLVGASGLGNPPLLTSIAFDARGALFGVGVVVVPTFAGPQINYGLYAIDPATGGATRVHLGGEPLLAIDFAPDGTLYATGAAAIFPIDPGTGERGPGVGVGGLFTSLDIDPSGIARGVEFSASANNRLFALDPVGSGSVFIAETEEQVRGLASVPGPAGAALLALAGVPVRRRR